MQTGWSFYETNQVDRNYIQSTCNLTVTEFRLNEPLADELFQMTLKEGVEVQDHRSGELQIYKQPRQWPSLLGKPLSSFEGVNLKSSVAQKETTLVICFVDLEQRPSRHAIEEIVARADDLLKANIAVVLIQVSNLVPELLDQWQNKLNIPFNLCAITGDVDKVSLSWGVKALPWLILTDKQHNVTAEGFSINDLDEKLKD